MDATSKKYSNGSRSLMNLMVFPSSVLGLQDAASTTTSCMSLVTGSNLTSIVNGGLIFVWKRGLTYRPVWASCNLPNMAVSFKASEPAEVSFRNSFSVWLSSRPNSIGCTSRAMPGGSTALWSMEFSIKSEYVYNERSCSKMMSNAQSRRAGSMGTDARHVRYSPTVCSPEKQTGAPRSAKEGAVGTAWCELLLCRRAAMSPSLMDGQPSWAHPSVTPRAPPVKAPRRRRSRRREEPMDAMGASSARRGWNCL
mmetsp:Transcript_21780/g.61628  ORF Transcript_21780/g.61628 Transcript_21780/m.61628 type:complete len:253 (-) Transcript_21780:15-773(-)